MPQQVEFDLGVVDGRKKLEDALNFEDPFIYNVAGEGNIANWSAKEVKSARSRARDTAIERVLVVIVGEVGPAPHQRLGWIHVKSGSRAVRLNDVDNALEVLPPSNEEPIIQVENVEQQIGDFFCYALGEREKGKSKEERGKRVSLLGT